MSLRFTPVDQSSSLTIHRSQNRLVVIAPALRRIVVVIRLHAETPYTFVAVSTEDTTVDVVLNFVIVRRYANPQPLEMAMLRIRVQRLERPSDVLKWKK